MSLTKNIAEARSYGLDIDPKFADPGVLHVDVQQLRAMDTDLRGRVIAEMNDGWTIVEALKNLRGW